MTKIFATLSARTLGDFTAHTLLASSIADLFDSAELYVCYRMDGADKDAIASYIRNAKGILKFPAKTKVSIPVEFFDVAAGRLHMKNTPFEELRLWDSDIILAGNMLDETMLNSIPANTLRPPANVITGSNDALVTLGLDPTKWVAAVHWEEGNVCNQGEDRIRTIYDSTPYFAAIRHIIANLGGQVVRLGHTTDVKGPPIKGLVDLTKVPNSECLQLYAVSISRFFIGSGSGPIAYGSALGVPTAVTDQNLCLGAWHAHDYIVTQNIRYNGQTLCQIEAYDAGILHTDWDPGAPVEYVRNTAAQLIAATDEMYRSTTNCSRWRSSLEEETPKGPRPNAISLPIPRTYRRELLIPPSLREG